jgi:hypothetical protein
MAIGYAPFSTIQQGNQQVVNSMANLGQQISNSIETHAQLQAAQTMLPSLLGQVKQGMGKISSGDSTGLNDVYGAAMSASQIPILAPMATKAIGLAQSANINAQHMLRTQAFLGGKMAGLYGQYGSGLMNAPVGMNPNWQGKQNAPKAMNTSQQMSAMSNFNKLDSELADKQDTALRQGDQTAYDQIAQQRQSLHQTMQQGGLTVPEFVPQGFNNASQLRTAQADLKKEQAKHSIFGMGGPDQAKIKNLQNTIQQLQKVDGQLPAARGSESGGVPVNLQNGTGPVIPQKAIEHLKKNPNTAKDFDELFGDGAAQQILNPQSSIDTSGGNQVAEAGPEAADESEAVSGGSEEENPS